jgi:NAD(P)H-hydrate epimerase
VTHCPSDRSTARHVCVLAGSGGNGGGALAAARRLHGWGATVRVMATARTERMAPATAHQAGLLERLDIPVESIRAVSKVTADAEDLILDGLLGYGGRGEPRGSVREAIEWMLAATAPVLALDLPSGLDATTGEVARVAVRAAATVTLAAPKTGLLAAGAAPYVGDLYLADIGVPPEAFRGLGGTSATGSSPGAAPDPRSWFARADILRLERGA